MCRRYWLETQPLIHIYILSRAIGLFAHFRGGTASEYVVDKLNEHALFWGDFIPAIFLLDVLNVSECDSNFQEVITSITKSITECIDPNFMIVHIHN